jgi:colanic acid biosynthesis glycosyl transferase WcaI
MTMRILMLTTYFAPDSAANAVIMTQLAEDLSGLGHEVTVLTSFPHYDTDRIPDRYRGKLWVRERSGALEIRRVFLYVPRKKNRILGRILSYASWNVLSTVAGIFAPRFDLLFVPSPPLTNGVVGFLISRLRGVPFVYNVQDVYPDIAVRLGVLKNARLIAASRRLERFVYRSAAAVSVISEGFRDNLLAKGVPARKVCVIPNFADTAFIRPLVRGNRLSAELGLDDRFVALFAGNIGLSQGLGSVLDTAELLKDRPEIVFLIVGNGASKAELVEVARRRDLTNVMFRPFFPYPELPEMYAASDVGLVPLKRGITDESVPSKVFSIIAAGRPVVACVEERSDTSLLLERSGCGVRVPPEDPQALAEALIGLSRDREAGRRMGERGRLWAESRHSRATAAGAYGKLFSDVLDGGV